MSTDTTTESRWAQENRQTWTDAHLVRWYSTWSREWAAFVAQMTVPLVEQVGIAPGQRVLDLASGPGEPAITFARIVGPTGQVTATDISAGMLETAAVLARAAGIANLVTQLAPADDLPFPDCSFECVTCRFGVMYFPDVRKVLSEVRRVLIRGGRVGFTVWPPDADHPSASHLALFARYFPEPIAEPGAPAAARFCDGVSLGEELRAAGFDDIAVRTDQVSYAFPGNVEVFDRYTIEQFQPAIEELTAEQGRAFVAELQQLNRSIAQDGRIERSGPVIVVSGRAP